MPPSWNEIRDRATAFAGDGIVPKSERNFALYLHDNGVDVMATAGPERLTLSM